MLLKGLPRAQLFLPAWTVRNWAFVEQRASKSSGRKSNGESQSTNQPTTSLLEELFPEESKEAHKVRKPPTTIGKFESPVRRVESIQGPKPTESPTPYKLIKHVALRDNLPLLSSDAQRDHAQSAEGDQHQSSEHENAHVLVLSNASKSLSLSDFLRLSPKGEHIDGWASGIIKGKHYSHNSTMQSNLPLQSSPAATRTHSSHKGITSSSSPPSARPANTWTN